MTARPRAWLIALLATLSASWPGPLAAEPGALSVATWNIRNLATPGRTFEDGCCARDEAAFAALRTVAAALDADLVAVQEVASPAALALVFPPASHILCIGGPEPRCLGPDEAPPDAPPGAELRRHLAFALRRNGRAAVAGLRAEPRLAVAEGGAAPEHPGLHLTLRVDGRPLHLLNVHLAGCYDGPVAAGSERPECRAMDRQAAPLGAWMDERRGETFLVLGDFNRRFDREGSDEGSGAEGRGAFWPRLSRADRPLARGPLAVRPCWPDDPDPAHAWSVDWIVAGGGAALVPGSSRRLTYDALPGLEARPIAEGRGTLSDHCPVRALVDP